MKKYFDLTLIKILASFYVIIVILTFFKRIYFGLLDSKGEPINILTFLFGQTFLDWFIVTSIMTIIAALTKKMLEKNIQFRYIALIHLFISLIIGWFIFLIASIILFLTGVLNYSEAIANLSFSHLMVNLDYNFMTYFVMVGIIYIYYYVQQIKKIEKQKSQLFNQLTNTKMQVLKAQLQPHFLFNTLNSISALIESNTKQAQNTLADLSDLLREILDLKENNLITLQQELNLLKKYLDIILIRFSDHLTIKANIEKGIENALIPSMLLQPIAENSFKHGFSYDFPQLEFELTIFKRETQLIIEVSNNGKEINHYQTKFDKKGKGLTNTLERLKTLYGSNFTFSIQNKENTNGVITTIVIPFEIAEAKIHNINSVV